MKLLALGPLAAALAIGGPAAAQTCPAIAGGSSWLAETRPDARLRYVRASLERAESRSSTWVWAWRAIFTAGVGELALVPAVAPDARIDFYTTASKAAVGVASTFVLSPAVLHDQPALEARLAGAGVGAGAVDCALLLDAEQVLVRDAASQIEARSWLLHATGLALNLGVGLGAGLSDGRWGAAAFNAVSGAVVGELHIFTKPTNLVDALRRYRAGDSVVAREARPRSWSASVAPFATARGYGLGLFVSF